MKRVESVIDSGVYTDGVFREELEVLIQNYLHVENCILVPDHQAGIELALRGLFKTYLDSYENYNYWEIIVPEFTPRTTLSAVINAGFIPKTCRVDEDYCVNFPDIERKISSKTVGIIASNLFGNICNTLKLDYTQDLPIIYDSYHALGCYDELQDEYCGNLGECEVFPFIAPNPVSGCGGFVTTHNTDLYLRMVDLQKDEISEFHTALNLTNFENIQEIQSHYFDIQVWYRKFLPKKAKLQEKNGYFSNFSYIIIEVDNRDKLIQDLEERNIFVPTPKDLYNVPDGVLVLPAGIDLQKEDIKYICTNLGECLK